MENPIDHNIDLGFVNFVKHPENENYTVFRFRDENRAKSFEIELCSSNIWFEKSQSSNKGKTYFLFGIHKNDFKKAQSINFKVEAQHKKRIIPGKIFRGFILIIGLGALALSIIGYIMS